MVTFRRGEVTSGVVAGGASINSRDGLSLCKDGVGNNESKGMQDRVSRCCGPVPQCQGALRVRTGGFCDIACDWAFCG